MATERGGDRRQRAFATAGAIPIRRVRSLGRSRSFHPLGWISSAFAREVEQRRLFPWIAVAYGTGILLAFAAEGPLSVWPPLVVGTGFGAAAVLARGRPMALGVLIALAATFLGFAAAVLRTGMVASPVLSRPVVGALEGLVESLEARQGGGRLVIRVAKLERLEEGAWPRRVRVSARALGDVSPGQYVSATARLLPPPEAARPGGYDFARDAYFRGIGGVGSISGQLKIVEPAPAAPPWDLALSAWIDRGRNALTSRIAGAIGGQAGAVAAALVTGKRGLIEEHTNDALRAAGIYHVVSISGLHMMLAAGVFFWLARALLALSPPLALNWPIKKIAALVGMTGAAAYCVFSGADVAAERSLLMILVMQGAILIDRPALSMRNLAISALLVLTREPEALLGPSFQMSYAAVAGLIALAEWTRRARPVPEATDPIQRVSSFVIKAAIATLATTLVATVATAPFSSFHFQNLQPYGLLGNAATLPLVSFVVMPCAVLGTIAYPFGLDRPVWWAMGLGVEAVLRLSQWVASLSGSTVTVPAFGAGALLMLALAILGTTIFVSGLRWLAALPAILGLAAAASHPRPDLYVARDGSGAAIRGREGRLVVVGRVPAFTVEQWLRADGDARRASDPSVRAAARCDPVGCTVPLRDGRVVSYVEDRRAFPEDCRRAAAIVSRLVSPDGCAAALVIDRRFLAGHGATAARAGPNGWELATARNPSELRPWLPPRPGAPPAREPDRTRAASETGLDRRGGERPGPSLDPDLPPAESPDWTRPPEFQ